MNALTDRPRVLARREQSLTFDCLGGRCAITVADAARPLAAAAAAATGQARVRDWHRRFSRFEPDSELSALNRDPRAEVPVSPLMARIVQAALVAAIRTGGLVDATLGREIRRAGYGSHFAGPGVPLALALSLAPRRAPARPAPRERAAGRIQVDRARGVVRRPPGLELDLGGVAKGVLADELAGELEQFEAYAVDLAGDVRLGGRAGLPREVRVTSPFDASAAVHSFELAAGAAATSGIGRRSWLDSDGHPAHHLLDPSTGLPAFTGVVQATALAPTAAAAEALAKAAVLAGPERAPRWLAHGGVVVLDDGGVMVLDDGGVVALEP